jgi:hypothetical protein
MAAPALAPLPRETARWRVEKLPVAEIRQRLQAAELSADGTKRTLAKRLHEHLAAQSSESESESASASGEGTSQQTTAEDDNRSSHRRGHHHRRSHRRPSERSRSRRRPSHSPSSATSGTSSSRGSATSTTCSSDGSSSRSTSPSPRRRRGRTRHGRSRAARSPSRSRSRSSRRSRHGHSGRQRHRRRHGPRGRHSHSAGDLPPIPGKLRRKIRRGEYVDLTSLLYANLANAASGRKRGRAGADAKRSQPAAITDLTSWAEAWSVFAAVLCSFYPHLAPRLFLYQHFLTLKSRSFRTAAWLRYDSEFRLKLAANNSWHFETVDTELWASCFSADGLAPSSPASSPLACYSCGSLTHLYAACPQRRRSTPHQLTGPAPEQPARAPANPTGERQEPCYIFNDKGCCFRGNRCPYRHTCTHCGGQHSRRSCPDLRPQ